MKYANLPLGYITMMLIALFFVNATSTWWIIQLIGLTILTIIFLILDRKAIMEFLYNLSRNSIELWLINTWNNISNWFKNKS